MSNLVNVVTDDSVMVLDIQTGDQVKFFSDDPRYERALDMIRDGNMEDVFSLDTKHVVENFFEMDTMEADDTPVSVTIRDGVGIVTLHQYNDMEVELESGITQRIVKMSEQGFHPRAMINFIGNLYGNPSATAVKELYGFIEACELPITEDGCFIAYKIVRNDYLDIYSGKMSNKVGQTLSMPRHLVDDNRENTCSHGLHFCSKEYLPHYGSGSRGGDRCMLVKINPADVVSIPADYNNAKGRTWQYEVVGEVADGWRTWLPEDDYTQDAVVSSLGRDLIKAGMQNKLSDKELAYRAGYASGYVDADGGYDFDDFSPDGYATDEEEDAHSRGYKYGYRDSEEGKKQRYFN